MMSAKVRCKQLTGEQEGVGSDNLGVRTQTIQKTDADEGLNAWEDATCSMQGSLF